ncbi:MAG: carbon storage regulator [Eubacteriales bacterium]
MLIISRKSGESFVIGDGIKISIFEVSSDKVKIGIEAPRDVKVLRSEVSDTTAINKEAAEKYQSISDIKKMMLNK